MEKPGTRFSRLVSHFEIFLEGLQLSTPNKTMTVMQQEQLLLFTVILDK